MEGTEDAIFRGLLRGRARYSDSLFSTGEGS